MFHDMSMSLSPIDLKNNERNSDDSEVEPTDIQEPSYGTVIKKQSLKQVNNKHCMGLFD
jgi:hypothetical protein